MVAAIAARCKVGTSEPRPCPAVPTGTLPGSKETALEKKPCLVGVRKPLVSREANVLSHAEPASALAPPDRGNGRDDKIELTSTVAMSDTNLGRNDRHNHRVAPLTNSERAFDQSTKRLVTNVTRRTQNSRSLAP